jgi:hypothetical protein
MSVAQTGEHGGQKGINTSSILFLLLLSLYMNDSPESIKGNGEIVLFAYDTSGIITSLNPIKC